MVLGGVGLNKNSTLTVGTSSDSLSGRDFEGSPAFRAGMEAKSGKLELHLSRDENHQPQQVVLRLYAAVPYPFAVVLPDKPLVCRKHCSHCLIQLKNFSVETVGEREFTVVIKNEMEGGKYLRFSVEDRTGGREDRDSWVNAFQHISKSHKARTDISAKSRHSHENINSRLPSLTEVSEELEEEEEAEVEQRSALRSCENNYQRNANTRSPLTPRRRILGAPSLEQISEEEGEEDSDTEMEFALSNSYSRSPSPLSGFEVKSRTGRSL